MQNNDRFVSQERQELKYRISYSKMMMVRAALIPYMRRDNYSESAPGYRYFVRSLYYDSNLYHLYSQKMAGDEHRVKCRARVYHKQPFVGQTIKLELKIRSGERLRKASEVIALEDFEPSGRCRPGSTSGDVSEEFDRMVRLQELSPVVLVDYEREGFHARDSSGIRATLDFNVRSVQAKELYPQHKTFFRKHHDGEVVLEFKIAGRPPSWLSEIIRAYGLKLVANSKFTQGIEVARWDRHHPAGVISVR